jgi:putative tricarboxylic transport membrane protein
MLQRDIIIGLSIVTFISVPFCYESARLGLGTVDNPGAGFMPFFVALILAIMSIGMIVSSLMKRDKKNHPKEAFTVPRGVIFVNFILILFGFFIEKVGFFVCAFIISIAMLKIWGEKNWFYITIFSLFLNIGIFVLFNLLLGVRLPVGILWPDG